MYDFEICREYKNYVLLEEEKEYSKLIYERAEHILPYILERAPLLMDLADEIVGELREKVKESFASEEIYVSVFDYNPHHYYSGEEYEELNVKNCSHYFECQIDDDADQMMDTLVEQSYDERAMCILEHLRKHDKTRFEEEIGKAAEGIESFQYVRFVEAFSEVLRKESVFDGPLEEFDNRIFYAGCGFSSEELKSFVYSNPHYKNMFEKEKQKLLEEKERAKRIEASLLDKIPSSPIDLYPLARTLNRKFVLHIGPTNSGKTYKALQALKNCKYGVYLAPLRLLAFECYEKLNSEGVPCHLITGEEEQYVEGATHSACTIELLDFPSQYDVAVIDEAQMIADKQRGSAWSAAVLGVCAKEIHVCAAPEAEQLLVKLIEMCGDTYEIDRCERTTPLVEWHEAFNEGFSFPKTVQRGDALIVFSKKNVLAVAGELQEAGIRCSVIYGNLPYETRQNEVKRFISGDTEVVVATDAIGMGMNLPIKRIVFLETKKYDGSDYRDLKATEVQQIAGRAGRQGLFDIGYYCSEYKPGHIKKLVEQETKPLNTARIGFSRNLVSVDGKLSEIIRQWEHLPDTAPFIKADVSTLIGLATEVEAKTEDKELVYNFITIPFDANNASVHALWNRAVNAEVRGEHLEFEPMPYDISDLSGMEQVYKECDLMYCYHRRFCDGAQLAEITAYKKKLTEDLTTLLSKQHLKGRRCKYCGTKLSWNYPYGMCQECHDRMYSRSYYDDDDWDDDWY